jgi:hypothetical protein
MNKLFKILVILLGVGILFFSGSCDQRQAKLPDWLEGQWETGDTLGFIAESWEIINDQYMAGEGLFITADGGNVIEVLNIFIRDGVLFYAAMIPNQNSGEEILFIDTKNNNDSLVFENTSHNYPKKITYYKKTSDLIEVRVSGGEDGDINAFTLKKIQE